MKNKPAVTEADVLIMGASLAGNCLARQLRIEHPQLSIVVVDRKTEYDYWVGESTIEVFYDYCVKTLHLGHYLESNHLAKHGLRFFFDSPEKDLPLVEMSELGRGWHLPMPAYQLDRAKFDRDMVEMNREAGIEVRMGVSVDDVEIDREKGHRVHTSEGIFRCRWLIDAAGYGSPLTRKLGHVTRDEPEHPIGSYWGRYENCPDFDELGDDEWREKVHYTSRFLSTNHFMYKGYWIWVIPVDDKVTSIGVCFRRDMEPLVLKSGEEMTDFFRRHKVLDQVIGEARCLDFFGLKKPQRHADPVFSTDRWFMAGMAAGFVDAMLSTSCAYIADTNRLIGKLIEADLEQDEARFASRVKHYNIYAKVWRETVLDSVRGMYSGRYDVQIGYYMPVLFTYFGISLPDSMCQLHGLTELADAHAGGCDCSFEQTRDSIKGSGTAPRMLCRTAEFLEFAERHDPGMAGNGGQFIESTPPPEIMGNALYPDQRSEGATGRVQRFAYEFGIRHYLGCMAEMVGLEVEAGELEKVVQLACDKDMSLNQAFDQLGGQKEVLSEKLA